MGRGRVPGYAGAAIRLQADAGDVPEGFWRSGSGLSCIAAYGRWRRNIADGNEETGRRWTKSADQEAMSDTTFTQWNSQRRVLRVTSTTMAEFVQTMDSPGVNEADG